MKAEIKRRISDGRVELGKVLPLDTPFVLLVDPSNLCNFKCRMCPTGDRELIRSTGRYNGNMSISLFKKIIDDTRDFSKQIKVLRLYKEGEPLINPNFVEMIEYAKQAGTIQRIDTTTNGLLLNKRFSRKIVKAGLDQINISVGVSAKQIYRYARVKVDFKKYYSNIRDFYENKGDCEVYIKSIKELLTEKEQEQFYDLFGDISDRVYLENLSPAWSMFKFEGIDMKFNSGHYGQDIVDKKVCPYIFYIMVINSDGKADLCVGDWKHYLVYADAKKESLVDIWNGNSINQHRIAHLEGRRNENLFCKNCQVPSHGTLENIDSYAKQILRRMKQ